MQILHRTPSLLISAGALFCALIATLLPAAPAEAAGYGTTASYIVTYDMPEHIDRVLLARQGSHIVADLGVAGVLVVQSARPSMLAQLPGVTGVARDRLRVSVPEREAANVTHVASSTGCATTHVSCGLQWDLARIHVPEAWKVTEGSPAVKVAVLDTGLRSTQEEVGANYDRAASRSFVQPSTSCPADATTYSSVEDFQGHGTWTNTHIAGRNGPHMTGIAPATTLLNIRVLGACGFGLDSWILQAMLYANQAGASIISMSLGGFLCGHGVIAGSYYCGTAADVGNDPATWKAYEQVVRHLRQHGTLVIAAAGNEHVELNSSGEVVNHSSLAGSPILSNPAVPDPSNNLYGLTEAPGGVPGVIAVAALNRVTARAKPGESKYGEFGAGRRDQLTYYSNYGDRIDVAAPGGSRNENLARFDCLDSTCARLDPSTVAATDNPGDFGAWGFDAAGNPCNTCYVFIQGTSMATPQVAGVAALALAAHPQLSTGDLADLLKSAVSGFKANNATPPATEDASKPTYNYDIDYGADGIDNGQMGTGVIDAAAAVNW